MLPRPQSPRRYKVIEQTIDAYQVVDRGMLRVEHPSFAQLSDCGGPPDLLVTAFEVFNKDKATLYPQVGQHLDQAAASAGKIISNDLPWPNEPLAVGPELFGHPGWLIPCGFLVPGKGDGSVSFVDSVTGASTRLTSQRDGWFYHRVRPVHWGPNNSVALLTARAHKPLLGPAQGELVLLIPRSDAGHITCEEVVLAQGPDVFFAAEDLDGDGVEELVTADFFGKKLELMWWEGSTLRRRELDSKVGTAFDVAFADLAGNGSRALVLTTHESGRRGGVYAYEIPADFKHAKWNKHTLLSGVHTRGGMIAAASPGAPTVFYPSADKTGKPWIFVSGDDSQRGHLLVPVSEDPQNWTYKEQIVLDSKSTIGRAAIADVDDDGHPEIFVPVHDANAVAILSIVPR